MEIAITEFGESLKATGLSANTSTAYLKAVYMFRNKYGEFTTDNLAAFKEFLVRNYKPQTVNLRILAVNRFLSFCGKENLRLTLIKQQQKRFVDNVISSEEYNRMKRGLLDSNDKMWYFMVWIMGATGARVSELIQIRVEDIKNGFVDILSKGGKYRRIYFPNSLRQEIDEWGRHEGISSGPIFLNNRGAVISTRGFAIHLKKIAERTGIDKSLVYPHSFRHMYAKNFLDKNADISMLADLLGHESIETTQIYLRRSSKEQSRIIDNIVTW